MAEDANYEINRYHNNGNDEGCLAQLDNLMEKPVKPISLFSEFWKISLSCATRLVNVKYEFRVLMFWKN